MNFQYIYVETPKVACSTIKRNLQAAEVDWDLSRLPEDVHDRLQSPLPRINERPREFWGLYGDIKTLRFCFVRNPFSRALSCYLDKFEKSRDGWTHHYESLGFQPSDEVSFRDFLRAVRNQSDSERNPHWMSQEFLLQPDKFGYDFVGRFENFSDHFARVLEVIGAKGDVIETVAPHATNAAKAAGEYFNTEEIELVREIYQEDFKRFGYGLSPSIL